MLSSRVVHRWISRAVPFVALFSMFAVSPRANAQVMHRDDALAADQRIDFRLTFSRDSDRIEEAPAPLAPEVEQVWNTFRAAATAEKPGEWTGWIDRRTGRLDYAEGPGLAWVPGYGNRLTTEGLATRYGTKAKADLATLEKIARAFLAPLSAALGVNPKELVLSSGRSGQQSDYLWFVDFDVVHAGLAVDGGRVFFRINNGNLIQFGTEGLAAPGTETQSATVDRARAEAIAKEALGLTAPVVRVLEAKLQLSALALDLPGRAGQFETGKGAQLVPVWNISVERAGGTPWLARIDAASGQVLALEDLRQFATAQVHGGVRSDATVGEADLPMPFASLSGAPGAANSAGLYNFANGPLSSTLNGTFVKIKDTTCGAISQSDDGAGNIDFLTNGGTDCTTPGSGGPGNTASARTQFYWINRIKEMGRGWLPNNAWLTQNLQVEVNLNQTCNAYWHPGTQDLNFFVSGFIPINPPLPCANTGELPGASLHEFGHGLDQFDGVAAAEFSSGESYADITGFLMTHNSCMAAGFFIDIPCLGYGDACTTCSGFRDVDWAKRESNVPHTAGNFVQPVCSNFNSPHTTICGTEEHCESYIATESFWDFINRDLPSAGSAQAWNTAERLWYLSRPTATKAWKCDKADPAAWTSNGCSNGSMFRVLRAADDDDGNLANGTPHGGAIFAALNRHEIACAGDSGANTTFVGCTPPVVPTLAVAAGVNLNSLSWTSSGAGKVYDVYRSENGCGSGFTKIANDVVILNFNDTNVASSSQYAYQVVAQPAGNEACAAPPSACKVLTGLEKTDVWSKDRPNDNGQEPDPLPDDMWRSRDIWIRKINDGGMTHENPEFGQTNFVNVQLYNKGTVLAQNVTVALYWAKASAGLAWPIDWHSAGSAVTDVDPSGTATVVIPWIPPFEGHVCLLVRILSAQDPLPVEVADPNVNVRNSNNLVWRNVNVVDLMSAVSFKSEMVIRNIETGTAVVKVSFHDLIEPGVLNPFLRRGKVTVDLGAALFDIWRRGDMRGSNVAVVGSSSIQVLGDGAWIQLTLRGREEGTIQLRFDDVATGTLQTRSEPNVFTIRQTNVRTEKVQGGVTYEIQSPALH